ncbi:MAG: IniB N-terminal domain-containing protein [Actinomycetota bacterium]|nr:IniB N-terminal domain-containing protein [Actinomycetota bacterium]
MKLLGDEDTQAEFEQDPHAVLAQHGLDCLTGQDVRDVAPLVADHEAVHVKHGGYDWSIYHDDDPVREIAHITKRYEVKNVAVDGSDEYNFTYIDDRDTIVNVDDRDTTTIQAEGDVTIKDSFNQDNDVNVIEDSFNQDNDGVDNKDGTIEDSAVAGESSEESPDSDDDTTGGDSDDVDNSETDLDASSETAGTGLPEDSVDEDDDGAEDDGAEDDGTEEAAA